MGSKSAILLIIFSFLMLLSSPQLQADDPNLQEENEESAFEDTDKHLIMGEENACRVFDVECQCVNPERTVTLPSRAFGRYDEGQQPCLSPEEIDNLVREQGIFRCLREMEGAVGADCDPQWFCRVPCKIYTD